MSAPSNKRQVNPQISRFLEKLMNEVSKQGNKATLDDKLKVLDRALKAEAMRLKIEDKPMGSAFFDDDEGAGDDGK